MNQVNIILMTVLLIGLSSAYRFPPIDKFIPDCPLNATNLYIPHETDCSKYYVCSSGILTLLNCPEGLHFNPVGKYCDYPANAGCENSTSTTDMPPTETTAIDTTPDTTPGTTPIETTTIFTPTFPDSTTGVSSTIETTIIETTITTDYPTSTTNELTTLDTTIIETTTDLPGTTIGGSTTSRPTCGNPEFPLIPHETDCDKLYICLGNTTLLFHCNSGFEFNYALQNCVEISNGGCTISM